MGKLTIPGGDERIFVQVQIVDGDDIITEIVDAPADYDIDGYGTGAAAAVDYAAVQAKLRLRRGGLRSVG